MNTAEYLDDLIQTGKTTGMDLQELTWEAARACTGWPYIYGDRGAKCTISHRRAVYNKDPSKKCYQNVRKKCQAIRETNPTGSCSGCKWYPGGKRVLAFDCRGYTYDMLLKVYGWRLEGVGATSQWNKKDNWTAQGTIDTVPEDVLVCIFQRDKEKPTVMAHTGFGYHGETMECQNGVEYHKTMDKKWTHWGIPKCVSSVIPDPGPGPDPTPPAPEPVQRKTLRLGDKGAEVKLMQQDLMKAGEELPKYGADGDFGRETLAAVRSFQRKHPPLAVDGVCGPKTWAELEKYE